MVMHQLLRAVQEEQVAVGQAAHQTQVKLERLGL